MIEDRIQAATLYNLDQQHHTDEGKEGLNSDTVWHKGTVVDKMLGSIQWDFGDRWKNRFERNVAERMKRTWHQHGYGGVRKREKQRINSKLW